MVQLVVLVLILMVISGSSVQSAVQMMVGVDDAGSPRRFYDDPSAISAFEDIGFDFLMHHVWGDLSREDFERAEAWAKKYNRSYFINFENSQFARKQAPSPPYRKPGHFLHPSKESVELYKSSPRFLGITYDEAEHWSIDGVRVTEGGIEFIPHFFDAEGSTLLEAYEGNAYNLRVMMDSCYPGLAANARKAGKYPIITTEQVFPIMHHLFAQAGMVPIPKLLKETMTPVATAMTMGTARQYGVRYWTTVDLWHGGSYPGHTPEALKSALLYSYWTGAEHTYIENFSYRGSLYSEEDGKVKLSPHGEMAKWFRKEYLPKNPRNIKFEEFAPEIIIVRFEDTSWGQLERGSWLKPWLYGATNLKRDKDTDYWFKIWNVISHGVIPGIALTHNVDPGISYRFLIPSNNVAVYDHLATDPRLFKSAKLVFLTGKLISPACMTTLKNLAGDGLTIVTTSKLAPKDMPLKAESVYTEYKTGHGQWIVTDDVTDPSVKALLKPYLGKPDEMRYVFGSNEVIFTAAIDDNKIDVKVKKIE